MDKINIAELLKDCPKGMELDCTMFDDVKFSHIQNDEAYPIVVTISDTDKKVLTAYGTWNDKPNAKCVIFPKGKTTWEGFVPPYQFNDGDIVATDSGRWVGIIKNKYTSEYYTVHCAIDYTFNDIFYRCGEYRFSRLATEEEKATLFKAIRNNGYKWNAETKTLEKLIEPTFKVGDKVRHKDDKTVITITGIKDDYYFIQYYNSNKNDYQNEKVSFKDQDKYELVHDKFDINTLVPFESRVLVRNDEKQFWIPAFWGCYSKGYVRSFVVAGGNAFEQCIPYEGNENLLGKTDNCDEHFKTWKN